MGDLAGVDDDLHLGYGVGGIGVEQGDLEIQGLGDLLDDGAQQHAVDGVTDLQVLVLGGVDPVSPDGLVDALLGEVIGQDHVTGVVGVAPLALVVVLVVGGSQMPALVQGHGVLLVAGVVAAGADLALAVANLDQLDAGVDDGIPVGEVGEVAEGGAGVVELADAVDALGLAQQSVVGLHTGVGGLVVQDTVVAGDDAGGGEGVDVAGAAGPGHFEAADGDDLALAGVEVGDGTLVGGPQLLAVGTCQAHVVQGSLGVDGGGVVKVVGVVGEGHEIHIGTLGQGADVAQSGLQGAGAVGVGGVGVELAEVQLVLGLAHGEGPGLGGGLAVGTGHGDGDGGAAVGQIGGGLPGDNAVSVDSLNGLAVHGHGDGGVLTGIGDDGGDDGPLVGTGLGVGGGGDGLDDGLVLDGDGGGAGEGGAQGVHALDGDGQALTGHQIGGDGVGAVLVGVQDSAVHHDGQAIHAEDGVDGDGEGVVRTHEGIGQVAEDDGGHIDDAAGQVHALGNGVEEELVNVIIGDIVHGVGLVGVGVVLQELAVGAVELGGPGLHVIAAGLAGGQSPVGVLGGLQGVEGVVAGAVGAQIAVGLIVEAVVIAVLRDGEDHAAVGGGGDAVLDGGQGVADGLGVILSGQDALGGQVVDDHLLAHGGQGGLGLVALHHQVELLGK